MQLRRRQAIVGVAVALAGCSSVRTEIGERADGVAPGGGHPLAGTTTVSIVDQSGADHDFQAIVADALEYWTANASQYADVDVTFEFADRAPDVEIVFLADRLELEGCQEHASEDILGCAPLLRAEHRPERPITVEVVAGGRPSGEVEITTKHELGHVVGLGHDDEPARIMSNDIEDRLPKYERRTDIFESFKNAWNGRSSATREYNGALNRWTDREYDDAVSGFATAAEEYRTAVASVETAIELEAGLDGMARPDTVDRGTLLVQLRRSRRWLVLASERADLMSDSAAARRDGDPERASETYDAAERTLAEMRDIEFPAPVDVAGSLGLVEEAVETGG